MDAVTHEVRRTGDGKYYIVTVDEGGNSKPFYEKGKLLTFDDAADAKDYIAETFSLKAAAKKVRRAEKWQ